MTTLMLLTLLAASPAPTLDLPTAIERALATHPDLAAAQAEVQALRADAEQIGAWDNPGVFFRLEAAPRDGDAWDGAGRIVGLSQALPLGGARGAARDAALADAHAANLSAAADAAALEAMVREAYAAAWHAQQTLRLRQEAAVSTARLLEVVARRTEAGDAAVSDLRRARMISATADVEAQAAAAALEQALAGLGALVGEPVPTHAVLDSPTADQAAGPVSSTGSLQTQAARARAEAAAHGVTAASRLRWPDLELELGLRTSPDGEAFDVGLRLELPLLDRGGARLEAARARLAASDHRARATQQVVAGQQAGTLARRQAAAGALATYRSSVVPDAEAALASVQAAFTAGDVGLTEVLQVTREWIDARQGRLDWERALAEAEAMQVRWQ